MKCNYHDAFTVLIMIAEKVALGARYRMYGYCDILNTCFRAALNLLTHEFDIIQIIQQKNRNECIWNVKVIFYFTYT